MSERLEQSSSRPMRPFLPPRRLPAGLTRMLRYWHELRRGENAVPFSDDVSLAALPELSGNLMLVDVFERPQRFRFSQVGHEVGGKILAEITGKFADELAPSPPLEFFMAQASATVEAMRPTFFRFTPQIGKANDKHGYSRLLLPSWGNGRIDSLLCAVV